MILPDDIVIDFIAAQAATAAASLGAPNVPDSLFSVLLVTMTYGVDNHDALERWLDENHPHGAVRTRAPKLEYAGVQP